MGNFRNYIELLEAGKDPIEVNWVKTINKWSGNFLFNDIEYNIEAYTNKDIDVDFNIWEFKFYKDKSTTMITGDFKAHFKIVPTISKAFLDFVKEKKPDSVLFLASDDSKSRKSLYKQNSDIAASKYNYISINPILDNNEILFGICKTKDMIQDIKELIGL